VSTLHWPLFGLVLRTPRLVLTPIQEADVPGVIAATKAGIHDPAVMPFAQPFTDAPSPELERNTYRWYWRTWAEWEPVKWALPFTVRRDEALLGIQSLHCDDARTRCFWSGSWLRQDAQGEGLGKEMRAAILHLAFAGLDAIEATSESFLDNEASHGVSRAMGYEENGRGFHAPRGEPREVVRWRLTRQRWDELRAEGRYPDVGIEGLEPCRPLLGSVRAG